MFKIGIYRKCPSCGRFALRKNKQEWKCSVCKTSVKDSDIDKSVKLG